MALNKRTLVKKKKGGHPPSEVWNWFVKGDEATAKPSKLRMYLAYECKKVNSDIRIKMLVSLTNDCDDSDNDTASTSTTASKKQKLENSVDSEFKNVPTSLNKEEQINKILLKMFVCYQELARVNIKVRRILDNEINLTIAFDRWTNPKGSVTS
ncbi:3210_t:CDS:2 [Cetraspora pellucida]|uniref:3210_t:CDS:1 n=2 Tax=Cetraspora pellucida TaxID=1433469 RepID=A0ACA9MFA9_9GLOM|nr:3209_t:CDS:2 [Cetraspora pellucida]CAG8584855.1 3210_t:CDS:2 [Cetraspora pellucida]